MDREKGVERVVEKRWLEHVGLEWTPNFHYPPITAGEVSGQQHHPTKSNSKPQTPKKLIMDISTVFSFLLHFLPIFHRQILPLSYGWYGCESWQLIPQ